MMIHPFQPFLIQRLQKESLPGRPSQLKMVPQPLTESIKQRSMEAAEDSIPSSVLILLFANQQGSLELILTLRTSGIDHGGQLSLPGGRSEGKETKTETALRETNEEIGIDSEDVHIAGHLSKLYIEHSNHYVTPVVGFLDNIPELTPNPDEVEEVFSVEIESLLEKKNLTVENWNASSQETYKVPFWNIHRVPLWGATAMILSEFLDLYREFKNKKSKSK